MLMRFRRFLVCGAVRLWVYRGGNLGGKTGTITASLRNFRLIILNPGTGSSSVEKYCSLISLTLNIWWGFIDSFAGFFFFSSESWACVTKQLPSRTVLFWKGFISFFFNQKEDVWHVLFSILWKLWVFDPSHPLPFNLTPEFLFPLQSHVVVCDFMTPRIVLNWNIAM